MILKFWNQSCGQCRAIEPVLEQLESKGIAVSRINTNQEPDLVSKFNIMALPTMIKIDEQGNELARTTGFRTYEQLVRELSIGGID